MFGSKIKVEAGTPYPLGATVDKNGINFSLFSQNATKVELCLFNMFGNETSRINMQMRTDDIWHIYVKGLKAGQQYGFRVYGPYEPEKGLRFNPNKLLLDPSAKLLSKPLVFHPSHLGYDAESPEKDLSFSTVNSAPFMPKCIAVDMKKPLSNRPYVSWTDTVVYETHLKGFTIQNQDIPKEIRGTFEGMKSKKIIEYLKTLGITSVELLPVAAFNTTGNLVEKGLANYWGYDPICFMAPQNSYLSSGKLQEIQNMVRIFHEAGIEVILDVVYNHTGEGSELGPTVCFRGIDNTSYYRLLPDNARYYMNDTGCGNCLNLSYPATLQLVLNSLRYWAEMFDIDGFRFDLATTLGRDVQNIFSPQSDFFKAIEKDFVLKRTKLIAEPWDMGMGGYQVGNFPIRWAQWNDRFRDVTRGFWKGDFGKAQEITAELMGTPRGPRGNFKKVNFITAHDGFSLYDLVSYNQKHNEANGEDNRDGNDNNISWNSGVEGETIDQNILNFRFLRAKAMMATLLLSNGIPMILSGDEVLRSQRGNNNAYAQDNPLSWFNWKMKNPYAQKMLDFVRDLTKLRREHPPFAKLATLSNKPTDVPLAERAVVCMNPDGAPMADGDWQPYIRSFAILIRDEDNGTHYFVLLNASDTPVTYSLPDLGIECPLWILLLDTSNSVQKLMLNNETTTEVPAWTMMVLLNQEG